MRMKLELAKTGSQFKQVPLSDLKEIKDSLSEIAELVAKQTKTKETIIVELIVTGTEQSALVTLS